MSRTAWKRMLAGALGALAVVAGAIAVVYAIEALDDFSNPAVPMRLAIIGEVLMCSMVFAALTIGVRLLRFSMSGRSSSGSGWVKAVLLGIGCFFPGFIFSVPLTILWATHMWPGDGQSDLAAAEASFYVGIATALISMVLLLRKRNAASNGPATENRTLPQ